MYTLGIDIGSSSVKVALLELASGRCADSVTLPSSEMPIDAPHPGWAEQDPQMWWQYAAEGIRTLMQHRAPESVQAIGITYQNARTGLPRSPRRTPAEIHHLV